MVAANGEYFGLFQMGKHERQLFGGSTKNVWDQARAGYRYYLYEIRNGFYGLDPWISSERCWG